MLHGQLLRGYGRFVSPGEDPRFEQVWQIPLPRQSEGLPFARLALVESWENASDSIDGQVMDLLESSSQPLRIAVLRLIGRTGNREFVTEVSRALDDRNHQVAASAALALGKLKGETTAVVHLREKAKRGPLPVRVAAVKGLADQQEWSTVSEYANDSNWKIRRAVANRLTNMPQAEATKLASKLIEDRSMEVAKEVITATKSWPLKQSAPILFAALERDTFLIRKMAARSLGAQWPAARRFPRGGSKRNRKSALARLRKKWQSENGDLISVKDVGSSKSQGKTQLTQLDREHENELARQLLDAESASEKQSTLNQLARLLENHTAKHQTAIEVQRSVQEEKSPGMWTAAMKCLSGQPWLAVAGTISRAQRHRSLEVRMAAANLIGRYSKQAPAEAWDASILDKHHSVVVATLAAMRKHGLPKSQLRVVKSLTQSDELETRVAAASCLAKHGHLTGTAAMERFALDDDARMKRLAARYLGLIGADQQIPTLIDMLDDESSVSLIALDSLTQIVGDKSPNFGGDTQSQRIRRWKRWYRKKTRESSDSEAKR